MMRPKTGTAVEPMKLSALQRVNLMPSKDSIVRFYNIRIADHDAANPVATTVMTTAEKADRLAALGGDLEAVLKVLSESDNTDTDTLHKQVSKLMTKANNAFRGRDGEKKVSATTPATRSVLWYLLNRFVRDKFRAMAQDEPEEFTRHYEGAAKTLEIAVNSTYLAKCAGVSRDSLHGNGNGCLLKNLEKLGCILARQYTIGGNETSILTIDTYRWFWNHDTAIDIRPEIGEIAPAQTAPAPLATPFLSPFEGLDTGNSSIRVNNNSLVQKQITKESGFGCAESHCAPIGATTQVQGTPTCTPPSATPAETSHSAPPAEAAAPPVVAEKIAEKLLESAKWRIFNAKNLAENKIRTNKDTAFSFISPLSWARCQAKMLDIVQRRLADELTLDEVVVEIETAIKKHATDLNEGKRTYIYAPEMYLRTDLKGTLWSEITTTPTPIVDLNPRKNGKLKPVERPAPECTPAARLAARKWLEEKGVNAQTVAYYTGEYGENALFWFVEGKKRKLEGGFQPEKSIASWLAAALKHVDVRSVEFETRKAIAKHAPLPGHIWGKWREVVLANTNDPSVRAAWQAAKAVHLDERWLTLAIKKESTADALESAESLRCFRLAKAQTGIVFQIKYEFVNN